MADTGVGPVDDHGSPVLVDQRITRMEVAVHDRVRLGALRELATRALEGCDVLRMLGSELRHELRYLLFEDAEAAVGRAECEQLVRPVAPGVLDSLECVERAIV